MSENDAVEVATDEEDADDGSESEEEEESTTTVQPANIEFDLFFFHSMPSVVFKFVLRAHAYFSVKYAIMQKKKPMKKPKKTGPKKPMSAYMCFNQKQRQVLIN